MMGVGRMGGGFQTATRSRGGGGPKLRLEPSTDDEFFIVARGVGQTTITRFQRDVGGSGGTDLGNKWPEFRVTGLGVLGGFNDDASEATWIMDEVGACDVVGRDASSINFGSYHGLGAGGALNSETITLDGESISHTAPASGSTFAVTNSTTATDGTDSLTRSLTVSIADAGALTMTLNSISASGMSLIYVGMPMATGLGFSEIDVRYGTAFNTLPLGSSTASAGLADAEEVRMRDPATGYYVSARGALPDIANFVRARTEKQTTVQRTKTYLAQFSSVAALAGAEFTMEWGIGEAGSVAPSANLVNADWSSPWTNAPGAVNGTVTVNGADLDMVWSSGTSNLRMSSPISGVSIGQKYAISVDMVSNNASTRLMLASNGTSTTSPTVSVTTDVGRNIEVFTASYASQSMMVRAASTVAASTKWRNPAAYLIAA